MNLWVIFLTGLTVGGLTCLAVQGGLLASLTAAAEREGGTKNKHRLIYITSVFLISKLIAYSVLGFLLGFFGESININYKIQPAMQLISGIYMIAVALNLLNIHPIFRYAIITPPKSLARLIRNKSKSKDIFAPAILGFMTIFIPCGTTVAMETLAISSANPVIGSSILTAFTLGTMPIFFGLGYLTQILGEAIKEKFTVLASIVIIFIGISSVNGSLIALNSPISLNFLFSNNKTTQNDTDASQNHQIFITSDGYSPNYIKVRKNQKATIELITKDAYSCASAFRIPTLGINKNLQPNETVTISFTPKEKGEILFTCSMGMYSGIIEVI